MTTNSWEIIMASFTAATSAQLFKVLWHRISKKQFNFKIFVQTGGMPSSHSASMVSMATSVGLIEGFGSTIFAVAMGIAVIVMYDAAGLRQAAGRMAGILNKIADDIYRNEDHVPERLRELLGHTPFEVIVGAFLGMATAYIFHYRLGGGPGGI